MMKRQFLFLPAMAGALALGGYAVHAQAAARGPLAAFDQADINHDGVVTRSEFIAARNAKFNRLDRNDDGVISRADFGRLLRFRPQFGQRLDALLAEADANHDGRVTRAELAHAPTLIFNRVDANRDGVVTKVELATAREHAEQFRQARK